MSKHAFIFPGQGAQVLGMGRDFYDSFEEAKEVFLEADEALSMNLSKIIFSSSQEELTQTVNSQPAIFVTSCAILRVLDKQMPELKPSMCGGLSLGEYSALFASKKIGFVDCVRVVRKRGVCMQKASEKYPGAMAAVMGLDEGQVKEAGYWVANVNCPGQVVIAGEKEKIEASVEELKSLGAKRVIILQVSGAFHSDLMKEAQEELRPSIENVELLESDIELVMNVVGDFVSDETEIRQRLIEQVAMPTRWLDCMHRMIDREVDAFIEIGPSQLVGMNRKIGSTIPSLKVEKVADLEVIHETIVR